MRSISPAGRLRGGDRHSRDPDGPEDAHKKTRASRDGWRASEHNDRFGDTPPPYAGVIRIRFQGTLSILRGEQRIPLAASAW
jgi:hypothetical protein